MRLKFDHKHKEKMFKFSNDYDPEKLIDYITRKCHVIADLYKMQLQIERKFHFEYEIKHSDIYCILNITFQHDQMKLNLEFELLIPDIRNSFCDVAGVRRYVQRQIRDTIWITLKSKTSEKVSHDLSRPFTLIFHTKSNKFIFNVQGCTSLNAIAAYMWLDKNKENKFHVIDNPVIQNIVSELQGSSESELLKIMNPTASNAQKKKSLEYIICYYHVSDLLQDYFESPSDIIYQCYLHLDDIDNEIGLDLTHRRVRGSFEMMYSHFLSKIIDYIMEALFLSNKNKRNKKIKLEPFQSLYEFILVENMFEAPLASVSNRARCTITGEGGFHKDSIPVIVKDVHYTQYNCVDPVVTPDRENAGVILYLSTTCELDKFGRFKLHDEFINKYIESLRR